MRNYASISRPCFSTTESSRVEWRSSCFQSNATMQKATCESGFLVWGCNAELRQHLQAMFFDD